MQYSERLMLSSDQLESNAWAVDSAHMEAAAASRRQQHVLDADVAVQQHFCGTATAARCEHHCGLAQAADAACVLEAEAGGRDACRQVVPQQPAACQGVGIYTHMPEAHDLAQSDADRPQSC
jgi:hypothetical protein